MLILFFDPVYSPAGSNKFAIEQSIIFNFNQYLEDVENGKVVGQHEDREVKISLNDILQFATGAQNVPAIGFSPHPTIVFQHDLEKRSAQTRVLTFSSFQ